MRSLIVYFASAAWWLASASAVAMGLMVEPAPARCGQSVTLAPPVPAAAAKRLGGSQAVHGERDIAWAWLGTPTNRYPHKALGSITHAATLHVLVAAADTSSNATAALRELTYTLPLHKVFEDLTVRLVDIDGDGRDEMVVIESDALRGSSIVVLGLRPPAGKLGNKTGNKADNTAGATQPVGMAITELARSTATGGTFYWLNPVGMADFDGDGKLDIASVTTPHVGGVLTLYHYRPPLIEAFAKAMDVSNHRMQDPEQDLAVIVELPGLRPTVIVPDMSLKALHALRWEASGTVGESGKWKELADVKPLAARVQRLTALPGGACAALADGSWLRVKLSQ